MAHCWMIIQPQFTPLFMPEIGTWSLNDYFVLRVLYRMTEARDGQEFANDGYACMQLCSLDMYHMQQPSQCPKMLSSIARK